MLPRLRAARHRASFLGQRISDYLCFFNRGIAQHKTIFRKFGIQPRLGNYVCSHYKLHFLGKMLFFANF
jgi:hypothetical protein